MKLSKLFDDPEGKKLRKDLKSIATPSTIRKLIQADQDSCDVLLKLKNIAKKEKP